MRYLKGYKFERQLKKKLEGDGWTVIRSGGSKKPDLVAAKGGKIIVIECKSTASGLVYLEKDEVAHLQSVADAFGGECAYCVKRDNAGWRMVPLTELSDAGKKFVIRMDDAE